MGYYLQVLKDDGSFPSTHLPIHPSTLNNIQHTSKGEIMDLQRWFLRLMMAILLTSILAPSVEAGTRNRLGVRTGYYFDAGDVFIGGEYVSPFNRRLDFNPNIEFILIDNASYITFNFDAQYQLPDRNRSNDMWLGGGLGILYVNPEGRGDNEVDMGINLLFGISFVTQSSLTPYLQTKLVLSDNTEFVLGFGLRF